jgi:hypothetical protein
MKRVLVVWEDRYFEALHGVLKSALGRREGAPGDLRGQLAADTANTNSAFARYVRETWPRVRAVGTPHDPRALDHVVFVIDGDAIHRLIPETAKRPRTAADVPRWHQQAETAWVRFLLSHAGPDVAPTSVHGVVLRWSRESVVLAGWDGLSASAALDIDLDHDEVKKVLAACDPNPARVAPAGFTDHFRAPLDCLNSLRRARGIPALDKNATDVDDALRAMARSELPLLESRVPDIVRLAERVQSLIEG